MKRVLKIWFVLLLMIGIVGCNSKPKGMSEEIYIIACDSLKIIDKYLESKMQASDTKAKLDALYDNFPEYSEEDKEPTLMVEYQLVIIKSLFTDFEIVDNTQIKKKEMY